MKSIRFYLVVILLFILIPNTIKSQNQYLPKSKAVIGYGERNGNTDIFVLNIEDGSKNYVTQHPFFDYNPQWIRNENKIIFYRLDKETMFSRIITLDLEKNRETVLVNTEFYNGDPTYSWMKDEIAYTSNKTGNFEIYILEINSGAEILLAPSDSTDFGAAFNPVNNQVAFVSNRTGAYELYLVNNDGETLQQLTFSGLENYKPYWSPDGQRLAYFSRVSPKARFDIFILDVNKGSKPANITNTEEVNEYSLGWKSSTELLFYSEDSIVIYNLQTGTQANLILGKR